MIKSLEDAQKEGVLENHIYNADCLDIMKLMKDKSVDLAVADPPYGVDYGGGVFSAREKLKGDVVFDAFLGSGTTALAAKQLKRNFIGIEISPDYCKIAEKRLAQNMLL